MQTKEFTGRSSQMRGDTPWLSSEDFIGLKPVEVEIENVFENKDAVFEDGRKQTVYSLSFAGKRKQLVLSAAHRKALVEGFGPDTKDWRGGKVALFTTKGKAFGEMRYGIRLKVISAKQEDRT